MRRTVSGLILLVALNGLLAPAVWAGNYMKNAWQPPGDGGNSGPWLPQTAPNLVGPWGQPVPVRAPASYQAPTGADLARAQLAQQYPNELLRQAQYGGGSGFGVQPAGGVCGPNGCGAGMQSMPLGGAGMMPPGMPGMPGMSGMPGFAPPGMPSPAQLAAGGPGMGPGGPAGAVAAVGAITGPGAAPYGVQRTEVRFVGPAGMKISWYAPRVDGAPGFTPQYLEAPARYNFIQASIYRLKLSDIPNRPGVELYPTLEVVPANPKTATFLAHAAVPVSFTEDDFEQVAAGNFVVKVIYLPDPKFQDLAATGPDEVVSSRLEPGVDPIAEAQRRGCILVVVRLGNIDLEAPNTPPMDAPPQQMGRIPPGMGGPAVMPGAMGMHEGAPGVVGTRPQATASGSRQPPGKLPALPATQGAPPTLTRPPILPGSAGPTTSPTSTPLTPPSLPTGTTPPGQGPATGGTGPMSYNANPTQPLAALASSGSGR